MFVTTPTLFSDWFSENNIVINETDDISQWKTLYEAIFAAGSGLDKNNVVDMRQVQKAMLSIKKQLASYTIQFIDEYTGDNVIPLCIVHPRQEPTDSDEYANVYYDGFDYDIIHHDSHTTANAKYLIKFDNDDHTAREIVDVTMDLSPKYLVDFDADHRYLDIDVGIDFESDTSIIGPDMSNWPADKVHRYMKGNGLCAYPVTDNRPSTLDIIKVKSVNDLVYPPI